MKITITSTDQIVTLDGVLTRLWEGHTESGIPINCFIHRISTQSKDRIEEFTSELIETNVINILPQNRGKKEQQ